MHCLAPVPAHIRPVLAGKPERCVCCTISCSTIAIWVKTFGQRCTDVCVVLRARNNNNKTKRPIHSSSPKMNFLQ